MMQDVGKSKQKKLVNLVTLDWKPKPDKRVTNRWNIIRKNRI